MDDHRKVVSQFESDNFYDTIKEYLGDSPCYDLNVEITSLTVFPNGMTAERLIYYRPLCKGSGQVLGYGLSIEVCKLIDQLDDLINSFPNQSEKIFIGEGGKALNAQSDNVQGIKKGIVIARQVSVRLKEYRWDNKQFAQAMGCSIRTALKIVRAEKNLDLKTISKLERVLGIKEIHLHKQES